MASKSGIELTQEELDQALALRARIPLNEPETKYLREEIIPWHRDLDKEAASELITWWTKHNAMLETRKETRDTWKGRFRLIFTSLGGLAGLITILYNMYSHLK